MDGGLGSRCVVRVYGADGAVRSKHVELRIHQKITLLHQVGISDYFISLTF